MAMKYEGVTLICEDDNSDVLKVERCCEEIHFTADHHGHDHITVRVTAADARAFASHLNKLADEADYD